jgi:hypothetical protein
MENEFQDFIADPRLCGVIESLKRSNDIFNIIDPNENQHSDILKWLFDPREGHGQGDAIFKDFLTAAYGSSDDNVLCNKDFFAFWTPSRIARTGFHSLISIREYRLSNEGRIDLLMVDTVNNILIIVENKHGAKLREDQLPGYYEEIAALRKRPAFQGYQTAHIVLDRNYGGAADEADNRKSQRNRWAFLDYQWLQAGALRAEHQIKRGNQSAGLVIAYCQKQTDYVPPDEKKVDDVLADVARDYRQLVGALAGALDKNWVDLSKRELDGLQGELWIFANHHPELIGRLQSKAELSYIESRLRSKFPGRKFEISYGKNSFAVFNTNWNCFWEDDSPYWPVCVHGWRMRKHGKGDRKFAIGIQYRSHSLSDESKESVRGSLEKEFPELKKGRQNAEFRILGKVTDLTETTLATKVQEVYLRLENTLAPFVTDAS